MTVSPTKTEAMREALEKIAGTQQPFLESTAHLMQQWAIAALSTKQEGDGWRTIDSAPKDGRTIEVRGVMRIHHMQGAKFAVMPRDWRPDTPHAEWRLTEWREFDHAAGTQVAVNAAIDGSGSEQSERVATTPPSPTQEDET